MTSANDYRKISADFFINNQKLTGINIYIKQAEKYILVGESGTKIIKTLTNYLNQGLRMVYVSVEDYSKILLVMSKVVAKNKKKDDKDHKLQKTSDELIDLKFAYSKVRGYFVQLGLSDELFEEARDIVGHQAILIKSFSGLTDLNEKFKKNCSSNYQDSIIISFFSIAILNDFSWKSTAMKEKITLGTLLSDLAMDFQDFYELEANKNNPTKLPEKIFDHPKDMIRIIQENEVPIPLEAQNIILYHHENHDGTGFPNRLNFKGIDILPSIHIIARSFYEGMKENSFDFKKTKKVVLKIKEENVEGNLGKAAQSLDRVIFGK